MFAPRFLKILFLVSIRGCLDFANAEEIAPNFGATPSQLGNVGGKGGLVPSLKGSLAPVGLAPLRPALDPKFYVVEQFCDQYGPAVRLANGAVYRLQTTAQSCPKGHIGIPVQRANPGLQIPKSKIDFKSKPDSSHRAPGGILDVLFGSAAYANEPSSVSLEAQQTSIKNQVRNTCTYYATIAGLEAAYKRNYHLTLDLSERYLNARVKMDLASPGVPLPSAEDISGAWDGGAVETNLHVIAEERVGVPVEALLPEVPAGEEFSFPDAGDVPNVEGSADQRALDDFNLADSLLHIRIPGALDLVPLPTEALLQARYRASATSIATPTDRTTLDWYRQQIASGREVIVQFKCCDGFDTSTVSHNVGGTAGHAALLIGYDDNLQEFQMKNSWGGNTWVRFAYDNITGGSIDAAGVILAVDPPRGVVLGRQQSASFRRPLDFDGRQPGRRGGKRERDSRHLPFADKSQFEAYGHVFRARWVSLPSQWDGRQRDAALLHRSISP